MQQAWYSPQGGEAGPSPDGKNICFEEVRAPTGQWYNLHVDQGDTIVRDRGGHWVWTKSPREEPPVVWNCTQCQQCCIMGCVCAYEKNGMFDRVLRTGEYRCIHGAPDPAFVCKACRKSVIRPRVHDEIKQKVNP